MQFAVHFSYVCRVVVRFWVCGLMVVNGVNLLAAPAPPVPSPNLDIPRIIQEERRRLEAARAAANKPPDNVPLGTGTPFVKEIEGNRRILPSWVIVAQTAEKEGRIEDAVAEYAKAFKNLVQAGVMPFMPADEIKPLAEGLTRIQLGKATAALQERDYDAALIAIGQLQSYMPEFDPGKQPLESTALFHAQAADLNRQVETAKTDFKRRSPSRNTLTRLDEIRGSQRKIEQLLRDGMVLYDAKDYDNAYKYFEEVIYLDPLNDRAESYLKRIHRMRILVTDKRREQLFRERVNEVNQMWIDDDRRHNMPKPNPYYRGPKGINIITR